MKQTVFHLHIDAAEEIPPAVERTLQARWGFLRHDFSGHPDGYPHYEPVRHLTIKPPTGQALREQFAAVTAYLSEIGLRGYVEAEVIPANRRMDLPEQPFNPESGLPCTLSLTALPPGAFRESEIHLTIDTDRSDPRAVQRLLEAGYFGAHLQKPWGTCLVLTAQGSRAKIAALWPRLVDYLRRAGGLVRARLKEERIVNYWISHSDITIPPVIG